MIKLIASDLDGTLLYGREDHSVSQEMIAMIREMKQKGILFAAASGRQYNSLKKLFEPVWEDMVFLCENGGAVFYKGELIKSQSVPMEELLKNVYLVDEDPCTEVMLSSATTSYICPKNSVFEQNLKEIGNHVVVVEHWTDVTEPCMKIAWWEKGGVEHRISYWKERIQPPAKVVTSGAEWLDLLYPGADKGVGIQAVQEYFGIQKEEIVAFGDNYNDIEMLEAVGYPVAMENGKEKIREICPYHTKRVEDTVRQILDGTFLEK